MKKLVSSGVTLVVSQRRSPAAFKAGVPRPFAMGSFDMLPVGVEDSQPQIGWILVHGETCLYLYAVVLLVDVGNFIDAITRANDSAWGGLSGGRFFNFVVRPGIVSKIVL